MQTLRIATNGVQLSVIQAGPDDGPLFILLHGFPEHAAAWQPQIERLAQAGFRVWAPDQRGHNRSDKPPDVRAYALDKLGMDIVGLIEAAGAQQAVIAGHDWGAAVAWWLAINRPEHVAKLIILNAPHPSAMRGYLRKNRLQQLKSLYVFLFQFRVVGWLLSLRGGWVLRKGMQLTARSGAVDPSYLAELGEILSSPGTVQAMVNWYRAILRYPPPAPADRRVRVPALIIWSEQDAFFVSELGRLSADLCDDAQLRFVEGASHWLHHEQPQRVGDLLAEFAAA